MYPSWFFKILCYFSSTKEMENVHHWDCGFGKSALLSLLFSVSVLKAHGHLFSYRMYYSITSPAWEGEKRQIQSNSFSLQSLLMFCHHTDRSYSQFIHWFMLSHPSYCSDLSRCWEISAQVMNHFLLGSCFSCTVYVYGFCWSGTECCGLLWRNRQTDTLNIRSLWLQNQARQSRVHPLTVTFSKIH